MVSTNKAINLAFSLLLAIISGIIISSFIDEFAIASGLIEIVPCDNIKSEDYTELCHETKSYASVGLSIMKITGYILPFFLVLGFLRKIGLW